MAAPMKLRALLTTCRFQHLCLKQFCRSESTQAEQKPNITGKENADDDKTPVPDSKPLVELDSRVAEALTCGILKHKHHAGILTLSTVTLPQRLLEAAGIILEKYPLQELSHKADKMANYLWSRHAPVTDEHVSEVASEVHQKLLEKKERKGKTGPVEQDHLLRVVRQKVYHWQPMTFDAYRSLLYMTSHLALNYSVLRQCFTEMSKRDPDFKPRSLYNLGSGTGSAIWAANSVWGSQVFEYYCVDKSQDMNTLARLLLQDGDSQKQMCIPGVIFRQFTPSPQANQFEVVVSAYTLLDVPGKEQRLEMLNSLWQMTSNYLVLVENGTLAGFSLINEARDYLLGLSRISIDQGQKGHVFAPCPHEKICPKAEKQQACFSQANYRPLPQNNTKPNQCSVRYSYIIMQKGPQKDTAEPWPRVIQATVNAPKHTHCHMCCADGKVRHMIFTSKKHGTNIYKCSRYTSWGDLFPLKFTPETNNDDS